ncbi:uncharacterized protein Pyn_13298 [Prunus yedoensis var. nudiflora]|uniref:Uncharacterized protein n=1 Tax=Prunus yedoensis var. nudiflora TaxID=2094558 RepID=A0A314UUY7_PRUYE|nr:uncharacterized protein Pyn_13298 [Prunus yedoensis var. nudiflora]
MHCAVLRTNSDIQKNSDTRRIPYQRKSKRVSEHLSLFEVNRQKVQKGPPLDFTYSVKSFTALLAKTSSRKKSRKKGKQSTKASNEPEVLSKEYANGSSASEPCGNNDGDGQVSSSTAPEISLPDSGPKNSEISLPVMRLVSCYSDMYTKGYSDMHDSFVLDSISIGSNSGDSTNAGPDEKHAEKEIFKIDISKPPGLSSGKGRCSLSKIFK